MKQWTKRRNLERATLFRAEFICYLNTEANVEVREFNSIKSLNQWEDRNDNDNTIGIMVLRKLALIDDVWEPYTTIEKKTITLSDLKTIVRGLEGEHLNSSLCKK